MNLLRYLPLLAVALTIEFAAASVVPIDVRRVVDGDTLVLSVDGRKERVRLIGVDATELDQEFGNEAKQALARLEEGRPVLLRCTGLKDRYGRILGSVAFRDVDVGLYLIERGYAWYFQHYGSDVPPDWRTAYDMAQAEAKYQRVGLWSAIGSVSPWVWRKQKREAERTQWNAYSETLDGATEELSTAWQKFGKAFWCVDSDGYVVSREKSEVENGDTDARKAPKAPDKENYIVHPKSRFLGGSCSSNSERESAVGCRRF